MTFLISILIILINFGLFRTGLVDFGPFWSLFDIFDRFGRFRTSLVTFGLFWSLFDIFNRFGRFLISLVTFRYQYLDRMTPFWRFLVNFSIILMIFGQFRTVLVDFGPFWSLFQCQYLDRMTPFYRFLVNFSIILMIFGQFLEAAKEWVIFNRFFGERKLENGGFI